MIMGVSENQCGKKWQKRDYLLDFFNLCSVTAVALNCAFTT